MTEDTGKFEVIAPPLRWMPQWVRENLSPRAVWIGAGLIFASGCGVTHYRSAFHEAQMELIADHKVLMNQTEALSAVNVTLARLDETLNGLNGRLLRMEDWRDGVQTKASEPVPGVRTPSQKRRAR